MTPDDVLDAAYAQTLRCVEGLTADDFARPTPCSDWDVRALLAHVVAATDGLVAMLRGQQPDWGKDALGADPVAAVRTSLSASSAAWKEPGAVDLPSEQVPGMRVVDIAMGDAVAHIWDLHTALGRPLALDDEAGRTVLERWDGGPAEVGRQFGAFGPRVQVPPDAPAVDRPVGLFGRDPGWSPAG